MKKLLALVLLAAMLGSVYADVVPERKLSRPLVNLAFLADYDPWLGPLGLPMLRLFAPGPRPQVVGLPPAYGRARHGDIPVPPVCDLSCLLRPIQGLAQ